MPEGTTDEEQGKKLFIGGLTYSTTDDMLKDFYTQWGELVDYIVMKDSATKRSRGFGFVTYADPKSVDLAMNNRPHVLDGKTVEAKRALPRDNKSSNKSDANMTVKRLYVSGVREEHTEEMFREHFGQYGNIVSVDIITDKATGKKRGFAYITFDDYDAVDKCVLIKSHMIDRKRCDVKKAMSRDEMKKNDQQYSRDRGERDFRSRGTGRGGGGGGGDWGGYGGGGGGGGYGGGGWNQGGGGWNNQGSGGGGGSGGWSQGGGGGYNQGGGNWNQGGGGGGGYYQGGGGGGYGGAVGGGYGNVPTGGYGQTSYNQDDSYQAAAWSDGSATNGPAAAGWGQGPSAGSTMQQGGASSWNQTPQGWQNPAASSWGQAPSAGAGRGAGGPWRGGGR